MMNLNFFNSLPKDLQTVCLDATAKNEKEMRPIGMQQDDEALKFLQARPGFTVYRLTDKEQARWVEAELPISIEYITKAGPKAVETFNLIQDLNKKMGLPYQYIK